MATDPNKFYVTTPTLKLFSVQAGSSPVPRAYRLKTFSSSSPTLLFIDNGAST
jgi:hypothetical protein